MTPQIVTPIYAFLIKVSGGSCKYLIYRENIYIRSPRLICQILGRISKLKNRIYRSQSEELNGHKGYFPSPRPLYITICMQDPESLAFPFTWYTLHVLYIWGRLYFQMTPRWDILTHIVIDGPWKIIGVKQIFCETASTFYPGVFFLFISYSEILDSERANLACQDCLRHLFFFFITLAILVLKIEKAHSQPGWC